MDERIILPTHLFGDYKIIVKNDGTGSPEDLFSLYTIVGVDTTLWEHGTVPEMSDSLVYEISMNLVQGCCIGNRGNIDSDVLDQVDISDLLYLVDYMFLVLPGEAPPCPEEADVNGDSSVDIADLLYLVDYMFANPAGPAPVTCN